MAEESRMNLAALQQRDPYISEIIDRAVKVTLYKFSQQHSKWSVTDIEGSLFVYRSPQQGDFRLSGPPSGQGADGGVRTRDRRVPADLRADSLATVPPTPRRSWPRMTRSE
ncbi:mRNA-decapping enzyme 1b [Plakobranchus ocellatus]|uniref:mRNA-decapping enzyme 1b n=1 Tax=Plakobranchus ocellatus TaxID=259542 RepID=A0AAV4A2U8_9GAST|nr:mRNA-decapping enzyme 1b [Plakobranchus ocellatus]